jgi:uncharacterized metal-binding protein
MTEQDLNLCKGGPTLIFSCSGAADVGEISDRAARKMTKGGVGAMFCMAGIGGRVEPIMQKTRSASKVLAIDGCGLDCVKKSLDEAGFTQFEHLRVTDLCMEKGSSPATDENVDKVVLKGAAILS